MAINRSTQAALTIALSIFVMLTFALGVTTYLYFSKSQEADRDLITARSEAASAGENLRRTTADMERLRQIIGVAADVPVDEIDTDLNSLVAGDFAGFPGDAPSFRKLLDWVRQENRSANTRVKTVEEEKKALAAQKAAELAAAETAKAGAEKAAADAKEAAAAAASDFTKRRTDVEQERDNLLTKKQAAEQQADALRNLQAEIARGLDLMSASRKARFQQAIADNDATRQLDEMRAELLSREKTIQNLNAVLARLRVADPELQQAIIAARPADDRIDGFNGHIVSVDPRSGTALISCRSTAGLRPGLILHVFRPDDPRAEFGARKGSVEVTEIEGPTLVRAVIRRQDSRDPLLSGDGVSSSLWAGGGAAEIVIVGFADLDGDGRSDRDALTALVAQAGGRVVNSVAASTALIVDLGQPSAGDDGRDVPGWSAESKRRQANLIEAKRLNVRETGLDGLLDMLGLDTESFRPGRLPRERGIGRLPERR
jgi:hypothetical protein